MNGLKFSPLRPPSTDATLAPGKPTPGEIRAKTTHNLLAHIPGEASGLYLLAVDSIEKPTVGVLAFVFALSLIVLVLVRWAAKASSAVMLTSVIAFLIWMLVFDEGLLRVLVPNLLPHPLGLIIAVFYSTIVTTLANAGKLS
jgi:hypothetical protein